MRDRLLIATLLAGVVGFSASASFAQAPESGAAAGKTMRPVAEDAAGEAAAESAPQKPKPAGPERICALIEIHAKQNGIPESFFARLIWKESRFDSGAVSPAGAEGIAQFMPTTAKLRGLADSFDIEQAIPASANYLAELRRMFGNLGLAAAAYNAGENRVTRWMTDGGYLPLETENYVLDITGEAADAFTDTKHEITLRPLDAKLSFTEACQKLPVLMTRTQPMSAVSTKPWAVIVAGAINRGAAIRVWEKMRASTGVKIAADDVFVSKKRSGMGRPGVYSVRIGADSRGQADGICARLKAGGGACIVLKNR